MMLTLAIWEDEHGGEGWSVVADERSLDLDTVL